MALSKPALRAAAALALALCGVAILLRVAHVSTGDVRDGIAKLTPTAIALMILGYIALNVVQAIRYRMVQRPLVRLRLGDALDVRFTSAFLNNVLPARGGDLFRIDRVARRYNVARATVVGGELHDMWIDKMGWLSAIAALLIFEPAAAWMTNVAMVLAALFACIVLATLALARLPSTSLARTPQVLRNVHDAFANRSLGRLVLIALFISPLTWLVETWTIHASLNAAGVALSPLQAFTVLSAINIAAIVPTPANSGAFEASGGAALIAAHVSPAFATAYILIYHVTQVIVSAVIGGAWLGLTKKQTQAIAVTDESIREVVAGDAWDAYVASRNEATLYHLRAWQNIAERGYGMRTHFLVAESGGRINGVLPLFRVPRPGQAYLTSGIFGAYGAVLADDPAVERALIGHASAIAKNERLDHLHLKTLGSSVAADTMHSSHIWSIAVLGLEESCEAQFAKLTGGMRNKIRKGEKSSLVMRRGHGELAAFYDVLAENMHRKGSPIYGTRFLQTMLDELGPRSDVVTLYEGDRAVSGALIAWFNGSMYVPFASSRPSAFALRVNYLLFWRLIEIAIANKCTRFDFGTSMQGASTLEFKEQWGTTLAPITSYFFKENGELPTAAPTGVAIKLFMRAWSLTPRAIVDRLGPFIIPWTA
jgi:FemAB-related protein (PEP-CTERM system-associated)